MIFVGVDWAEAHNDVVVMDEAGTVLGRGRFGVGVAGLAQLHGLIADHAEEPDRGDDRHRDRSRPAGRLAGREPATGCTASTRWRRAATAIATRPRAPSPMPPTPSCWPTWCAPTHHNHRPLAGDSDEASAIRVLARAHQGLVWMRQRQVNGLRSALRDYFPGALAAFGTDLASPDALAVLAIAPTPRAARGALAGQDRRGPSPRGPRSATSSDARPRSRQRPARRAARGGRVGGRAFGAASAARVAVLVSLNAPDRRARGRAGGAF